MAAQVTCINAVCGRKFGVPDDAKGKKVQCPFCQQIFRVAQASPSTVHKAKPPVTHRRPSTGIAAPAGVQAKPAPLPAARRRRGYFVTGAVVGGILAAAFLAAFLAGLDYLRSSLDSGGRQGKGPTEELPRRREQFAEVGQKADNDAKVIADLRKQLAESAREGADRQTTLQKLREQSNDQLRELQQAKTALDEANKEIAAARQKALADKAALDSLKNDLAQLQLRPKDDKAGSAKPPLPPNEHAEMPKPEPGKVEKVAANAYTVIDKHALAATPEDEASLERLATYLAWPCKTDKEKARAIYRWITDRIVYNMVGFKKNDFGDSSPEAVLKNRKAVCDGYANLFVDLSARCGVKAVKLTGNYNGRDRVPGQVFFGTHAWNAVQWDGKWWLIDACWGRGADDGTLGGRFSGFYFCPPPDQLIFTHFPDDPNWQLSKSPVTRGDFEKWPAISIMLWDLGVTADAVRKQISLTPQKKIVNALWSYGKAPILLEAPLQRELVAGKNYLFRLKSADHTEFLAIQENEDRQTFAKSGSEFRLTLQVKKGKLLIAGFRANAPQWSGILEYIVE
jgi:hypothetical protein